jgi:hypothetical protein
MEIGHLVLGAWLTTWLSSVERRRALFGSWRSGLGHCSLSYNSEIVTAKVWSQWQRLISSHSSFTVGQCQIVTKVRRHSERSWWNTGRRALQQHGRRGAHHVRGMTTLYWKPGSEAEAQARCWLRSRPEPGRGIDCARGRGVGRHEDCARAQGVGRGGDCARAQGVGWYWDCVRAQGFRRGRDCARAQGVGRRFYSFLPLFVPLIWVFRFMVPNNILSFWCNKYIIFYN